jgi:hypothetical protein
LQERLKQWYDHCDEPENNDIRPDISKANELLQWDEPIPYPGYTGWIPPALGGGFYEQGLVDLTPIMAAGVAGVHFTGGTAAGSVSAGTSASTAVNGLSLGERIAAAIGKAVQALRSALKSFGPILGR